MRPVSRRGDDEWRHRSPSPQVAAEQPWPANVPHYWAPGRGTYGTRRSKPRLRQAGQRVSRRRLGRWLAQAGLRCNTPRRGNAPTAAGQAQTVAPNHLNREWTVPAPDTVDVGDRTDLPRGAGWRERAVGLALYSRAVGGWSMAAPRRAEVVNQALSMASCQRQPATGLIMHPDRGSPDGADSDRQLLTRHGLQPSMRRTGNGWIPPWQSASGPLRPHASIWRTRAHEGTPRPPCVHTSTSARTASAVCRDDDLAPLADEQAFKTNGVLCPEQS